MPDDYEQAAARHFRDAVSLAEKHCFDNAGHLIGISAECAVKKQVRLLENDPNLRVEGRHRSPLRRLRTVLDRRRLKGPWLALCTQPDYLSGWEIDHRYSPDGTITEAQYRSWHQQVTKVLQLARIRTASVVIEKASRDGNADA